MVCIVKKKQLNWFQHFLYNKTDFAENNNQFPSFNETFLLNHTYINVYILKIFLYITIYVHIWIYSLKRYWFVYIKFYFHSPAKILMIILFGCVWWSEKKSRWWGVCVCSTTSLFLFPEFSLIWFLYPPSAGTELYVRVIWWCTQYLYV